MSDDPKAALAKTLRAYIAERGAQVGMRTAILEAREALAAEQERVGHRYLGGVHPGGNVGEVAEWRGRRWRA